MVFKLAGVVVLAAHFVFLRVAYDNDRTWLPWIFALPPLGWLYGFRSGSDATKVPAVCSILAVSSFAAYVLFTSPASVNDPKPQQDFEKGAAAVAKVTRVYYTRHERFPTTSMDLVRDGLLTRIEAMDPYGNPYEISQSRNRFYVLMGSKSEAPVGTTLSVSFPIKER